MCLCVCNTSHKVYNNVIWRTVPAEIMKREIVFENQCTAQQEFAGSIVGPRLLCCRARRSSSLALNVSEEKERRAGWRGEPSGLQVEHVRGTWGGAGGAGKRTVLRRGRRVVDTHSIVMLRRRSGFWETAVARNLLENTQHQLVVHRNACSQETLNDVRYK